MPRFASSDQLKAYYDSLGAIDYGLIQMEIYRQLLRPGDWAVDGGANRGQHTLMMARQVAPAGQVLAFEPVFPLATAVKALIQRDYPELAASIQTHCLALSNWRGKAPFFEAEERAYSSLRRRENIQLRGEREVRVGMLDDFSMGARLRLIKLDLEGGEFDAMRGARNIIEEHRPVLMFEYDSKMSPASYGFRHEEMLDFLESFDYRLIDIVGNDFSNRELWKEAWLWDFVALPPDEDSCQRVLAAIEQAGRQLGF